MNYRLYSFVNFYLSSIQQGVQTAHLVANMFTDNWQTDTQKTMLHEWATKDKTLIILNGGASVDILEKLARLTLEREFPTGSFAEDADSLNGLVTCCGIVLPERIWGAMDYKTAVKTDLAEAGFSPEDAFYYNEEGKYEVITYGADTPTHQLITMIKSCGLAR
jgi:hypothetical protein